MNIETVKTLWKPAPLDEKASAQHWDALAVGDVQQNEVRAGERRDRLFSLEIEQLRAVPAEILVEVALVGNVLREAAGEIRVVRKAEIVADEVAHEAEPH